MNERIPVAPEGYALVRTIGRGASSVVWEARALGTDTAVALKILETDVAGADALRTFTRERDAMNALVLHPNILTILAADVQDGRPWIAMELCRRGSLASYVADGGPLEVPTVLRVLDRLADALSAAHRSGVVHCDIKPANVMLTDGGEPALGDFGIARVSVSTAATTTGAAFTLDHVAPELLDDGRRSPRSDIYSLGTTAWQLLVGVPPFRQSDDVSVGTVLTRILRRPLPESEHVPDDVLALLRTMTAKDPDERPASMTEVAAAVQALAQERGVDLADAALPPLTSVQLQLIEIMSARTASDGSAEPEVEPAFMITGPDQAADAPRTDVVPSAPDGPRALWPGAPELPEDGATGLVPSTLAGVPLDDSVPPRVMPIYNPPPRPQAASDGKSGIPLIAASVVGVLVVAGAVFGLHRSAPEPAAPAAVAVEAPVASPPPTTPLHVPTSVAPTAEPVAAAAETSSARPAPPRRPRTTTPRPRPTRRPVTPAPAPPPPVARTPDPTDEPDPVTTDEPEPGPSPSTSPTPPDTSTDEPTPPDPSSPDPSSDPDPGGSTETGSYSA